MQCLQINWQVTFRQKVRHVCHQIPGSCLPRNKNYLLTRQLRSWLQFRNNSRYSSNAVMSSNSTQVLVDTLTGIAPQMWDVLFFSLRIIHWNILLNSLGTKVHIVDLQKCRIWPYCLVCLHCAVCRASVRLLSNFFRWGMRASWLRIMADTHCQKKVKYIWSRRFSFGEGLRYTRVNNH